MLAALKTHVDLREALAIEAVKCAAGDSRHDFQEWYPKYKDRTRKAAHTTAGAQADDVVDPAVAAAELAMIKQAIHEHEVLLAEHRTALVERKPSRFSDADVDALHATLESLRASIGFHELALAEFGEGEDG